MSFFTDAKLRPLSKIIFKNTDFNCENSDFVRQITILQTQKKSVNSIFFIESTDFYPFFSSNLSAWQKAAIHNTIRMAKSSQPPSGIGARFATTEALASPRSNPAGIPSNSVAAPKSWFPSPKLAAPKPASNHSNTHSGAAHRAAPPSSFAARRQASKMRIKPSHQSPSLQPLPFSAASSEKSSPRCLPS